MLQRFRNNLLSITLAEITGKALGAVLYVMLARYLGPEQFGIYSLAVSYGLIFGLFANLGLDTLIIKDVARDLKLSETYFSHAVLLKLAGGFLSFCFVFILTIILGYAADISKTILIFACVLFIMPLNEAQAAIFKAHQQMGYSALMQGLRPIVNLILVIIAISMGLGVKAIAGIHVIRALIIYFLFYTIALRPKYCRFSIPKNFNFFPTLLKSASPFILIGALYIVNARAAILIVSKMVGVEAVGWYSAANELVGILFVFPTMLSTVLFPELSKAYGESDTFQLTKVGNFVNKALCVIGVPSGIGLFILAPEIIGLIYGPEYHGSIIILRILSFDVCFFFSRSIISWLFTAIEQVKILMKINLAALAINVLLTIFLIPVWGYPAAAVGSLIASFFTFTTVSWFLARELKGLTIIRSFLKPILASLVMSASLLFFEQLHLFLKIGIGIAVYGIASAILGTFEKEEIALFRRAFALEGK